MYWTIWFPSCHAHTSVCVILWAMMTILGKESTQLLPISKYNGIKRHSLQDAEDGGATSSNKKHIWSSMVSATRLITIASNVTCGYSKLGRKLILSSFTTPFTAQLLYLKNIFPVRILEKKGVNSINLSVIMLSPLPFQKSSKILFLHSQNFQIML